MIIVRVSRLIFARDSMNPFIGDTKENRRQECLFLTVNITIVYDVGADGTEQNFHESLGQQLAKTASSIAIELSRRMSTSLAAEGRRICC